MKLDLTLPVLSIRQPWAWAICGLPSSPGLGKDVENREWPTKFRGRFLVHAGKTIDRDAIWFLQEEAENAGVEMPAEFPTGGIVGKARLVDCVTSMESRWFFGTYGFVLTEREPVRLLPLRGRRKFFRLTAEERVAAELWQEPMTLGA